MSTYLQIPLSLSTHTRWHHDLCDRLSSKHIHWITTHFHFTLAFIYRITDEQQEQLKTRLSAYFIQHPLPDAILIDELIAFTSVNHGHVIAVSSSQSTEILQLRNDITTILDDLQVEYNPSFITHLTLAKDISPDTISLDALTQTLQAVQFPSFRLQVTKVEYIQQSTHAKLATWP